MEGEDLSEDQALFLENLFSGTRSIEDLPKGHFTLEQGELDEEKAEVSVSEFLCHYHTVADHLERGFGTQSCALSPEAWIRLHSDLFARMINSLYHTKMEGLDDVLLNILTNRELDLIKTAGGHAKTVATAFAQFPLNIHQCDSCLRQTGDPLLTEADFTTFLHATDRSQKALHHFVWKLTRKKADQEIERLYNAEIKARQSNIDSELQTADAKYRVAREAEIKSLTESSLNKFADEYYNTRKQAMIGAVDLTIRKEKDLLLHRRQAELLPLSTGITLNAARQALDEGLAESSDPLNAPPPASLPLPGASQLDSVIAGLTDTIIAKINDLAETSNARVDKLSAELDFRLARLECRNKQNDRAAASGGGFVSARQVAYIHECATDNASGHQLSQLPTPLNGAPPQDTTDLSTAPFRRWDVLSNLNTGDTSTLPPVDAMQTQEDFTPPNPPSSTTASGLQNRAVTNPPHPGHTHSIDTSGATHQPNIPTLSRPQQAPKPSYASTVSRDNAWHLAPSRHNKHKPPNPQTTTKPTNVPPNQLQTPLSKPQQPN
jgi:hypothetical protein